MKFKEFEAWCNKWVSDGRLDVYTVLLCWNIIAQTRKIPSWKREKEWKKYFEQQVMDEIVNPIEEKIKGLGVEE